MRKENNFIKYVFSLFVLGIIIATIYFFLQSSGENVSRNSKSEDSESLTAIQNDLRLSVSDFDTMNPILSNNRNVQEYSNLIYSSLFKYSPNYVLENDLVESLQKTNAKTYKIILKDNYLWQGDNGKVTSDDVRFTIERINANKKSVYKPLISGIDTIESVNDRELIFNLKNEKPFFEYNLTFPIMKKVDVEYFKNKEKYSVPISSGKYIFKESSNNILKFVVNPKYNFKNTTPKITNISIIKYEAIGEAYNAFKTDNIDVITTNKPGSKSYVGSSGYNPEYIKGRNFYFLAFNTKKVDDKNIRKGISKSIDFNKLLLSVGGLKQIANYPLDYGNHLFNNFKSASAPENKLEYNLTTASIDFAKSGFKYNGKKKKYLKDGDKLELNVLVNEDNLEEVKIAEALRKTLLDTGVTLELIKTNADRYYDRLKEKNYDSAIIGIKNDYSPNISRYLGEGNYSEYNNKEILDLIKVTESLPYDKSRASSMERIYNKIETLYLEDLPFIGLIRNSKKVMFNYGVVTSNNVNMFNIFQNIEKWYRK